MKRLVLVLSLLVLCGCSTMKFNVCGIDVAELRQVQSQDIGKLAVGVAASFATHVAGHYLFAEFCDVSLHQDGLLEKIDYSRHPSQNDLQWVARGGFLLQLAVNTVLVELLNDSYFTKGYTAFTTVELATYHFRNPDHGDFVLLDQNGADGDFEYRLYAAWAAYNFLRISIEEVTP